ncbi:MAG: FAD:protein FMN transferase [Pseudomonadales bacterium]|nr:FAD:protein FMN transferase [Pseudomonadales bacterium]
MDNQKRLLPFAAGLLLLGVAFFLLYQKPIHVEFSDATMGTRYQVKISDLPRSLNQNQISNAVYQALTEVDQLMSTYKPNSDISRFNRSKINEPVLIDPKTLEVIQLSKQIYNATNGAFDITVGPIVRLWGFGPEVKDDQIPSVHSIELALSKVGFSKIQITEYPPTLSKLEQVEIDLSAIAKGYGVDQVAAVLDSYQLQHYLIEVGGEIRVKGHNKDGQLWRIGIEAPSLIRTGAQKAIAIKSASVATSGDYRNFFEISGQRFSHTIDPYTGAPVKHDLASVTLISDSCAQADAYATAISVLGPIHGFALAEKLNLSAYFLVRDGDKFQQLMTSEFRAHVEDDSTLH